MLDIFNGNSNKTIKKRKFYEKYLVKYIIKQKDFTGYFENYNANK